MCKECIKVRGFLQAGSEVADFGHSSPVGSGAKIAPQAAAMYFQ